MIVPQPRARRPSALVIFALLTCAAATVALMPGAGAVALAALLFGAVVLILARPDVASVMVIFLIYTNAVVVFVKFHGLPDVAALALPLALCAPFAWRVLLRREVVVITPALPWMFALLVVQLLSAAFSAFTTDSVQYVLTYVIEGIALFFLVVNVIRSRGTVIAATWSVVSAAALLGVISAIQQVTGTYANSYFGFAQVKATTGGFFIGPETLLGRLRQPEASGPIGDPNFYAQIMLIALPLGLALVLASRRPAAKVAAAGMTIFIAAGMILTYSRGAAVAAVALVPLMLMLRMVRWRHVVAVALATLVLLVAVPEYAGRIATLDVLTNIFTPQGISLAGADVSLRSRATENLAAALMYVDHPILGVGPGEYPAYYLQYADRIGLEVQVANRLPHDLYLGVAAETGTLGILAFLGILGATILALLRARQLALRSGDHVLAIVVGGFILSTAAFMLSGLFLHLAFARYAWLMLALANAAAATVRSANTVPDAVTRPSQLIAARSLSPEHGSLRWLP